MTAIKYDPALYASEYIAVLGGDCVINRGGTYYVAEYDPETETAVPVLAPDNSGAYIAVTPHITAALYMENDAAGEPKDENYAAEVLAAVARLAK